MKTRLVSVKNGFNLIVKKGLNILREGWRHRTAKEPCHTQGSCYISQHCNRMMIYMYHIYTCIYICIYTYIHIFIYFYIFQLTLAYEGLKIQEILQANYSITLFSKTHSSALNCFSIP